MPPQDWCIEDPENVEDTEVFYDEARQILTEGHSLDLVDWWNDTEAKDIGNIEVSLKDA